MASLNPRLYSATYVSYRSLFPALFPIFHGAKSAGNAFLSGQLFGPLAIVCASLSVQFIKQTPACDRQTFIVIDEVIRCLRTHGFLFRSEIEENEFCFQLFERVCNWNMPLILSLLPKSELFDETKTLAEWEATGATPTALRFMYPAFMSCVQQLLHVVHEYVFDPAGNIARQQAEFQAGFDRFLDVNGYTYLRFVSIDCWPRPRGVSLPHQLLNKYLYDMEDHQTNWDLDDRMLRHYRRTVLTAKATTQFVPDDSVVEYLPADKPVSLVKFVTIVKNLDVLPSPIGEGCSVCLDSLSAEDCKNGLVVSTACDHIFHGECLNDWVNKSAMAASSQCPVCRETICPERSRKHPTA